MTTADDPAEESWLSGPENPLGLAPGADFWLRIDGLTLTGRWVGVVDGWLHLDAFDGAVVVALASIDAMGVGAPPAAVVPAETSKGAGAKQTAKKRPAAAKSEKKAPAITPPPDPDMIRRIVGGFLDDQDDKTLAQRFGIAKREISTLRAAFECGRGNMVEDQLPALAMAWLPVLRDALSE